MIFASNRTGDFDIYRKDLHRSASDGSRKLVRLTSSGFYEGTPAVEAGGTVVYRSSDGQKIYRIDPDDPSKGSSLVPTTGMIRTPAGSPDGGKIIFGWIATEGAQMDVVIADAHGGNQVQLTATPDFSETDPTWQPTD